MLSNIEAERARRSITKRDLAVMLGVSRTTLSNWIKEDTEIPASKLIAMSDIFGCTIDHLLGRPTLPDKTV